MYTYDKDKRTVRRLKGVSKNDNSSVRFLLFDNADKDDEILLRRWFLKKVKGMTSIKLDKHKWKAFD